MGEEYAFRGLVLRVAASLARGLRAAAVVGTVVSSLVFMVAHLATDPWLNLCYLVFGASLAVITRRTNGLEVAIVVHAVNNAVGSLCTTALHVDLVAASGRGVGAGGPFLLAGVAMLAATALMVW